MLTKISKKMTGLCLVTLIVGLPSCAQYQANYQPPHSAGGMQCVNSCLTNQQACNNNCANQKMVSNIASSVGDALTYKKNRLSGYSSYGSSSDDCGCKAAYDECYRSCGGKISVVCVANCKK